MEGLDGGANQEGTTEEEESHPTQTVVSTVYYRLEEFEITAYCSCRKCCGKWATIRPVDENGKEIVYTSTGSVAEQGKTIAVDPSVIPYGTEVFIDGNLYIAEDCGGAIKGNRIDMYFESHQDALQWGRQTKEILIKEN